MHIQTAISQIRADLLSLISASHPGAVQLERAPTAKLIGVTPGYLSNKQCEGKPVLPCVFVGSKPLYQISDIVDFLLSLRAPTPAKRGPKTKASKKFAQIGGA